ncbi:MAG: sigma-70 family RNA polymerase sigma factor [Pseudomonadota bacterium]
MFAKRSAARGVGAEWAVVRARSPQSAEFEQLYADYSAQIAAHCARLLRDGPSAEDATQDVFLRVRRHAGRLPDHSQIRPWLFRVATNHCLNELRSRAVRTRYAPDLHHEHMRDQEESITARDEARRLLARLPKRAREVAWLTFVEGMPQCEVAMTLGVSRRTVVTHLSELRAQVRQTA